MKQLFMTGVFLCAGLLLVASGFAKSKGQNKSGYVTEQKTQVHQEMRQTRNAFQEKVQEGKKEMRQEMKQKRAEWQEKKKAIIESDMTKEEKNAALKALRDEHKEMMEEIQEAHQELMEDSQDERKEMRKKK